MTSDMKKDIARDIKLGIHQFTDIIPEIYFRDDSESIMIVFEKVNKFISLLIVRN